MATKTSNRRSKAGSSKGNVDRLAVFNQGASEDGASWGDCEADWLQTVVVGITRLGGAVTFGMNRENTTLSVTLLLDDGRRTMWLNTDDGLDNALKTIAGQLEALYVP